jgi:hypothetical protein
MLLGEKALHEYIVDANCWKVLYAQRQDRFRDDKSSLKYSLS